MLTEALQAPTTAWVGLRSPKEELKEEKWGEEWDGVLAELKEMEQVGWDVTYTEVLQVHSWALGTHCTVL